MLTKLEILHLNPSNMAASDDEEETAGAGSDGGNQRRYDDAQEGSFGCIASVHRFVRIKTCWKRQ